MVPFFVLILNILLYLKSRIKIILIKKNLVKEGIHLSEQDKDVRYLAHLIVAVSVIMTTFFASFL